MYFRLRYIIRDFEFGDAEFSVSDPAKQIEVVISKRPADKTRPKLEANQRIVTATCQREIPQRHYDEAFSSGELSCRKGAVRQIHDDLKGFVLHILQLARGEQTSRRAGQILSRSSPDSISLTTEQNGNQ